MAFGSKRNKADAAKQGTAPKPQPTKINTNPTNETMSGSFSKDSANTSPIQVERKAHDTLTYIGSKTDLVVSPDGKSIQLAPEQPKVQSPKKTLLADSTTTSPIFRNDVRQEWIDAMFGTDFFPLDSFPTAEMYTPPKEGMGLAQIPSYLSYCANIESPKSDTENEPSPRQKVGVTLSRIPIGVYVRMVDIESEAFSAGIVPGSVLIDINGMGVLGEPSHKLLERLWVYEGHFSNIGQNNLKAIREEKDDGSNNTSKGIAGPVAMTFIKDGQIYTTVLLTSAPFGISWAPCGNFALVQRSYAFAQKAGVRRGCLVAAINSKSMRELDHLDTAMELKDQFAKGKDVRIICIFTPAASRTNFHTKKGETSPEQNENNKFQSINGVRFRRVNLLAKKQRHEENPTEYGVGSFFSCGTGANYAPESSGLDHDFISELANRVAAGEIAAPTGMKRGLSALGRNGTAKTVSFEQIMSDKALTMQHGMRADEISLAKSLRESEKKYKNECPLLQWKEIMPLWNNLDALMLCLRMQAAEYNEEKFISKGGMTGGSGEKSALLVAKNISDSETMALHTVESNMSLLRALKADPEATTIIHSFLLQMVALMSSENLLNTMDKIGDSEAYENVNEAIKARNKAAVEEMIDIVVDVALHNDDLCQCFHFLLRSFAATYAKLKPEALEMFSASHRYLKMRLIEKETQSNSVRALASPDSVSFDGIYDYDSLQSSSTISHFSYSVEDSKSRKRGGNKIRSKIGKIFKTKSKRNNGIDSGLSSSFVVSESIDIKHSDSSSKTAQSRKNVGKKKKMLPTSILRKGSETSNSHYMGVAVLIDLPSIPDLFENMGWFISHLDDVCKDVENSLLKSFSQKLTEWALQPWSASKDKALADCTSNMRNGLTALNDKKNKKNGEAKRHWSPVLNPMDSREVLLSVVPDESFILPSAHFPLLLCFNSCPNPNTMAAASNTITQGMLHRVNVRVVSVRGKGLEGSSGPYVVHASILGNVKSTGRSVMEPYYGSTTQRWDHDNELEFESRLENKPRTVEIKLSSVPTKDGKVDSSNEDALKEEGFAFVDISKVWSTPNTQKQMTCKLNITSFDTDIEFDQSGIPIEEGLSRELSVELEITTESNYLVTAQNPEIDTDLNQRRMLLYKHDEDMRQEMLAIQFICVCDKILKASGLDLKMKTYRCIPVGENKGFIEWVPGAISLSEVCNNTSANSDKKSESESRNSKEIASDSSATFKRSGKWCKHESLRSIKKGKTASTSTASNPIQDFLRTNAYDPDAPYFIKKDVMDNFVKSCAGYCVVTYLLGVGDRHTDNLLLHPDGHFLHCDYSFILGQDPKTFLPMRITEDMVNGMGGKDSDNFAKFLSLAGAAFVSLRQHSSVRILMTLLQSMTEAFIPDISKNQDPVDALKFAHDRFCVDLSDDEAVIFLEENIERSLNSKIWMAVDTIHSISKHF